jgi:hypothetical protein
VFPQLKRLHQLFGLEFGFQPWGDAGEHYEFSMRVCGRVILSSIINYDTAQHLNEEMSELRGCGPFVCSNRKSAGLNTVIDLHGSIEMVPTIAIRRFNPSMSLDGAKELVKNFMELLDKGGRGGYPSSRECCTHHCHTP